jgi:acetyl esterase/lipase
VIFLSICISFSLAARSDAVDQPKDKAKQEVQLMEPTREEVFKTLGDVELKLYVFEPEGHKPADSRPAIVFFFGGGWRGGSTQQFYPQCKYLASRGMVAISAEYRVRSRHEVTPFECVTDGKSAIRWVRADAQRLGIDPNRIAAGGGSAGGHVAACTGVIDGLDEPGEDSAVGSKPNALVLFNPVLVIPWRDESEMTDEQRENAKERFGGRDPRDISPYHHVTPDDPPTIILHGEADKTIPIRTARMFVEAMSKAGNRCELAAYAGKGHGFFNYRNGQPFYDTMYEADKFLASIGYLEGPPTLDQFKQSLDDN